MTSPFLLFMHIPKAAGTTLRSILDLQYGRENVITFYNQPNVQLLENLDYLLMAGRHDYKALVGHFNFGVHENLSRPSRYITFMREPVSRAISSYYENLKTNLSNFCRENGTPWTLDEALSNKPQFFANQQTKLIGGYHSDYILSETEFKIAIQNLEEKFLFAGTIELFDESLLLLSRQVGWDPCLYRRQNVRKQTEWLSPDTIDEMAKLNEFDIRLYKFVNDKLMLEILEAGMALRDAKTELESALKKITNPNNRTVEEAFFPDQPLPIIDAFLRQ